MTTLTLVKNELTVEDALLKYIESLPDDLKYSKVSGMMVLGVGSEGPFYSVVKSMQLYECVGLLEQLKLFLLDEGAYDDDF